MNEIKVRTRTPAGLSDGIREEEERIAFLERTPERELVAELRRELYDAEDAIPEDKLETLPRFILDFLHTILDARGLAAAIGLLEDSHTAHLLRYFPTVRDVLRRYDIEWHRRNLLALQGLDSGDRSLP